MMKTGSVKKPFRDHQPMKFDLPIFFPGVYTKLKKADLNVNFKIHISGTRELYYVF